MRTIYLITATLALCLAVSAKHPNLKIFGGKLAEPGQFPFIVSIVWNRTYTQWYFGSAGSIINDHWILTTAISPEYYHFEPKDLVVVSGTNQINTGGINYGVSQIVVHPKFNISSFENNIALFKIEGSFAFSDLIQPVKLGEVSVNDFVVVAGWGFSDHEFNRNLHYAELSAWSNEECNAKVEDGILVGPGEVCAFGGQGVGFCAGDSGAPLIFNGTLVGLASRIIHFCGYGVPDVYTRVSFFHDWINEVIGKF